MYGKIKYYSSKKNIGIKQLLVTFYYTHRSGAQPSSEKLPSVTDSNNYKDPQPHNIQRVRNFRTCNLKLDVCFKSLHLVIMGTQEEKTERV